MSGVYARSYACPYCGHRVTYRNVPEGLSILRCYSENGGCQEQFVISLRVVTTFAEEVFNLVPKGDQS